MENDFLFLYFNILLIGFVRNAFFPEMVLFEKKRNGNGPFEQNTLFNVKT